MVRFSFKYLAAAGTLACLLAGCTKTPVPGTGNASGQPANLTITISTESAGSEFPETRAVPTNMEDSTAANGDIMNSLAVFMVDASNNIVSYANSEVSGLSNTVVFNTSRTKATVTLNNIVSGSYTIYYIANRPASMSSMSGTGTFQYADYALPTLSGTTVPNFTNTTVYPNGMPVTLKQAATINYGSNHLSAELIRAAGRLSVDLYTHMSGYKVSITSLTFSNINPSDEYLFLHDTNPHGLPAANTYRGFPAQFGTFVNVDTSAVRIFDSYLYESHASSYLMNISGALFSSDQNNVASVDPVYLYSTGSETTNIETSKEFFILSSSSNGYNQKSKYLYMDGTILRLADSLPTDIATNPSGCANYRWKFSGTSSGTIQNVGTQKYIYYSTSNGTVSGSTTASNFTFGTNSNHLYFRASNYTKNKYYYFFSANANPIADLMKGAKNNNAGTFASHQWTILPYPDTITISNSQWVYKDSGGNVLTPLKTFNVTSLQLNYINKYGSASPLSQICRNEYLYNTLNLYYNTAGGNFQFDVLPWVVKNSTITFE